MGNFEQSVREIAKNLETMDWLHRATGRDKANLARKLEEKLLNWLRLDPGAQERKVYLEARRLLEEIRRAE